MGTDLQILLDSKPVIELPDSSKSADVADALSSAIPGVLQYLQELGIGIQIDSLVKEITPRIAQESTFAGNGGILVLSDLELITTDAGDQVRLVGNSLHYVGIGASPVEAQLAELTRPTLKPAPTEGWTVDLDRSTALWIKREEGGKIRVWQLPKRKLLTGVLAKYSERNLAKYDWEKARADEIQRLVTIAELQSLDEDTKRRIRELGDERSKAIKERDRLNVELSRELERASQAAKNAFLLRTLAGIADIGLSAAKEGLSGADKNKLDGASSKESLLNILHNIGIDAKDKGNKIEQYIRVTNVKVGNLEQQRIDILTLKEIPTSNIPSGNDPQIGNPP